MLRTSLGNVHVLATTRQLTIRSSKSVCFQATEREQWFCENKQDALIQHLMHFTLSRRLAFGHTLDVIKCDVIYSSEAVVPNCVSFYLPSGMRRNVCSHRRRYNVTLQIKKYNMFFIVGEHKCNRKEMSIKTTDNSLHIVGIFTKNVRRCCEL